MFTGIIEAEGTVNEIVQEGSNIDYWIESGLAQELKVDQSVAHNGVCLTVVQVSGQCYRVTAVAETLAKTTLGQWKEEDVVNLERALKAGDRLDGHFVQGHVDCIGTCTEKVKLDGSWLFRFEFPEEYAALVIEKGSICINGVSLTAFNIGRKELTVTIIPYTYNHTNFGYIEPGDAVNLEFDVLGKYLLRQASLAHNI
ncbi:MAG: riboflavin synthase [Flavipsychrobacter sp.]|nr:riboflavin synthase [Flavipsychrobacter sp.]